MVELIQTEVHGVLKDLLANFQGMGLTTFDGNGLFIYRKAEPSNPYFQVWVYLVKICRNVYLNKNLQWSYHSGDAEFHSMDEAIDFIRTSMSKINGEEEW